MDFIDIILEYVLFYAIVFINNWIIMYIMYRYKTAKQYNILIDNNQQWTLLLIFIFIILHIFYFVECYQTNIIVFLIFILLNTLHTIFLSKKYKKDVLFNYIKDTDTDSLNWYKIYNLKIDDELKEKCFDYHNVDIKYYKQLDNKYQQFNDDD